MPWCRECDEAAADLTDCPQISNTYSNISKMSRGLTLAELATHQSSYDIRTYVKRTLAKKKSKKKPKKKPTKKPKKSVTPSAKKAYRKRRTRGNQATKSPDP